ncbi:hypothetical protein CR513_46399, partial [Mucuna pruriens]
MSKPTRTNPKGPKKFWVPKSMIFLFEMCLTTKRKSLSWYSDNGCSRHVMGKEFMFQGLRPKEGGWVTFRSNQRDKIVRVGRIGKHPFLSIDNVLFVKGLKHNLLSISQLCDSGYDVSFNKGECIVKDYKSSIIFSVKRLNTLYKIDMTNLTNQNVTCLVSINDDHWTWHKKLGHASLRLISKLKKYNLIKGGKHYGLVVVDDYSTWTWVIFFAHKDESFKVFYTFYKHVQNEKGIIIASIHSDHEGEFENGNFQQFYEEHGIHYNSFCLRTPQHNGVVERKNRSLHEMVKTMNDFNSPKYFFVEVVNTTCYLQDKIYVKHILKKTPYEDLLDGGWIKVMQEKLDQFQ